MISFPDKKYNIIYADPPWKEQGGGKIKRGADRHYPLMKTKDIVALPVPEITADDAHLYLWVTNNFLPDGLQVVEAWGFRYVTMITWVKDKFGLGQYFRGQTEHVLFGVKGMIPYKKDQTGKRCQAPTFFEAPRRKHSAKPEEMRRIIEHVSVQPGMEKLEMFARKIVPGWDVWGNEVDEPVIDMFGELAESGLRRRSL